MFVVLCQVWRTQECRLLGTVLSLEKLWCCFGTLADASPCHVRKGWSCGHRHRQLRNRNAAPRKGQNLGVVRQALSCVPSPVNCAITLLEPVTRLHKPAILFIHEKARRVKCTSQQCATLPLLLVWTHTNRRGLLTLILVAFASTCSLQQCTTMSLLLMWRCALTLGPLRCTYSLTTPR